MGAIERLEVIHCPGQSTAVKFGQKKCCPINTMSVAQSFAPSVTQRLLEGEVPTSRTMATVPQGCGGLDMYCIDLSGITPHLDEDVVDRGGGGSACGCLDDEA